MENVNFATWSAANLATLLIGLAFGWAIPQKVVEVVEESNEDLLDRVLLTVPGIGEKLAKRICSMASEGALDEDALSAVPGIGAVRARAIMEVLEGRAECVDLEESNPGPRTATRERWERVQDRDIANPQHPNAPAVWMRAHDHTSKYHTWSEDNPVIHNETAQLEADTPTRLMQEQAPNRYFYSQSKSLLGWMLNRMSQANTIHPLLHPSLVVDRAIEATQRVLNKRAQQDRNRTVLLTWLRANTEAPPALLLAAKKKFEKKAARRGYRKQHVKTLRRIVDAMLARSRRLQTQ